MEWWLKRVQVFHPVQNGEFLELIKVIHLHYIHHHNVSYLHNRHTIWTELTKVPMLFEPYTCSVDPWTFTYIFCKKERGHMTKKKHFTHFTWVNVQESSSWMTVLLWNGKTISNMLDTYDGEQKPLSMLPSKQPD